MKSLKPPSSFFRSNFPRSRNEFFLFGGLFFVFKNKKRKRGAKSGEKKRKVKKG